MNALSEDDCIELAALVELGALLAEHVRLEERRLFPLIEASVPDEDLANLAATLRDQA